MGKADCVTQTLFHFPVQGCWFPRSKTHLFLFISATFIIQFWKWVQVFRVFLQSPKVLLWITTRRSCTALSLLTQWVLTWIYSVLLQSSVTRTRNIFDATSCCPAVFENPITKISGVMCQMHNLSQSCFLQQGRSPYFSFTLPCLVLLPPSSESLSVLGALQVISQGKKGENLISLAAISVVPMQTNTFQCASCVHCCPPSLRG